MLLSRNFLLGLSLFCAACSPYQYGKEITEFSKDVGQISTALSSGIDGLAADRTAQTRRLWIEDRTRLRLAPSCDVPVGKSERSRVPCTLIPLTGHLDAPTRPGPQSDDFDRENRARLLIAVAVLTDYAKALAAVTNADDRAAFDKSVTQLADAVGEVTKFVPGGAGTIAPIAINLFGWLVGTALDQQRFDALKSAVNRVDTEVGTGTDRDKPIHAIQVALTLGLADIMSDRSGVVRQEAKILVWRLGRGMSEDGYRTRLTEVEALVTTLEGFRRNNPDKVGEALQDAHDKLVKAVNDPSRSFPALLKALGEFKDKATALKNALSASSKPSSNTTKGGE